MISLRASALGLVGALSLAANAQETPRPIKDAIQRAEVAITRIVQIKDSERTFDNTLGALDNLNARLDDDTSLCIFLENVSPSAKERDDARAADEEVSNWQVTEGKREDLYKAIKTYADTSPQLTGEQARLLKFTMRDYHRAGMDLSPEHRSRLASIEMELNKLGIQFQQGIADDETTIPFTLSELKGTPKDVLDRQIKSAGLVLVALDSPTFSGMMDFCENEQTRQRAWTEFKRRGGHKNVEVLEKMIRLRAEQATILGYKSSADYTLEPRMAKDAATVAKFYRDLRPIVRKKAALDWKQFTDAKRADSHNPKATFQPWDYSYYKNKLMRDKYAVDSRKVAEYFPMQRVIGGLFSITQSLYGVQYKEVTSQAAGLGYKLWHPDVKLYEVNDKATGKTIGRFFLDLYPREGKYTHAACWGLQGHKVFGDGSVQIPLAALVCNVTKPTASKPSLLPHDEVETIFHEFGHVLHNMFSSAHYGRFSGTSVERDFVEAPSQMFENWVWDGKVLNTFAGHYQSKKPFPASLLKGMLAARNLGSGLEAEHQFYYGIVDQKYHTAPGGVVDTTKTGIQTLGEVEQYKGIPGTFFQSSFDHLVGYDSAYYGYQWSLVYAQDMYQRFEQLGVLSPKAGAYYREKILSKGGTEDAFDMLHDYLGRAPKLDAFLRHLGISK